MREALLHNNEKLLQIYHQTEWVLAKTVLIVLVAVYLPWFFLLKYELFVQFKALLFIWTLVVAIYGVRNYLIWYLQRYIITNQRLIHVNHVDIFKKVVIETPLERILNVSFKTTGLFSSLFNFGDVEVQVVGLMEPIILKNIKHPRAIKDYLWTVHGQSQKNAPTKITGDIPHMQEKMGYTKRNQKVL